MAIGSVDQLNADGKVVELGQFLPVTGARVPGALFIVDQLVGLEVFCLIACVTRLGNQVV